MNLRYLVQELRRRRRRTLSAIFGLATAVALLVLINALAQAYRLDASLKEILGKRATVASPETFVHGLGGLFALADRFALALSLCAILIAVLVTGKTMAGNVGERAGEIGVLKAVGWTGRQVVSQITAECLCQCLLAGLVGLALAWLGAGLLGLVRKIVLSHLFTKSCISRPDPHCYANHPACRFLPAAVHNQAQAISPADTACGPPGRIPERRHRRQRPLPGSFTPCQGAHSTAGTPQPSHPFFLGKPLSSKMSTPLSSPISSATMAW